MIHVYGQLKMCCINLSQANRVVEKYVSKMIDPNVLVSCIAHEHVAMSAIVVVK